MTGLDSVVVGRVDERAFLKKKKIIMGCRNNGLEVVDWIDRQREMGWRWY